MRRPVILLVPVFAALGVVVPASSAQASPLVQVTVTVNPPAPPPQSLLSICLTVGANGPNCIGDQAPSPVGTAGVVVVTSWDFVVHQGYSVYLRDVHFTGQWHLGGTDYQFAASTPVIGLYTGPQTPQLTVFPFTLTGIGPAGSFAADCGLGSAALQPELVNAPQLGGLLTFSVACTGMINGGTAHAFTLSAQLVLPPPSLTLGGTVLKSPGVGRYGG